MNLILRLYRDEEDYWRIRAFLREVFLLNNRLEKSWQVYRFDYCRWHVFMNISHNKLKEAVAIWETAAGRVAGVVNLEGTGEIFIQAHPGYQTPELEEEMIEFAEKTYAITGPNGQRTTQIWAHEDDRIRRNILLARGYSKNEWPEFQRRRPLSRSIDNPTIPSGYSVRSLGDKEELPARSMVSWRAFHPDAPDSDYEGWEWYLNVQRAPLYRRDLDLVAVAPDGELASFCTVWFDDVTRTGAFEPVGTAPKYQKLGLGKAVMTAGLQRLKHLGATLATVSSFTPPAHALYSSMGFKEHSLLEPWRVEL
jgi:GNAT superfamily N-acetyltransferase